MKISDPLISMVFPWGSYRSYYNGQDIEYLLKKVRIRGKFNVFLTPCVIACRLPPYRGVCGVDFPISMTINSTIFSFVTVNHAQDLMCLKFEALLMNKLHPSS